MRYRSKPRLTGKRVLGLLLILSVVGLLLPTRLTGRLMNLVQVLVPLQDAATRAADGAGQLLADGDESVSGEEHRRLAREAQGLRNRVTSQSARIATLEEANRQLTGIRRRGLGPRGVLIPARVVGDDLLGWRDSRLIDAGTLRGVQPGAPVTTRWSSLDVGSDDGARDGMAVLAGEVLIGWVEQAGTHTTRVRLLTDPASRMSVTLGRFEDGEFRPVPTDAPAVFWLESATAGRMQIVDVAHHYVDSDQGIRPGDRVVTPGDHPQLPVSLMIGTVTEVQANPENPLLYILAVESAAPTRPGQVYVLNIEDR
jgi:cell shape-determining protein MreC